MSFTDRYIKLPIRTVDRITGKGDTHTHLKLNPFHIVKYRPAFDSDDINEENEIVQVTDINGEESLIYLTEAEFEKKLNSFYNQQKQQS